MRRALVVLLSLTLAPLARAEERAQILGSMDPASIRRVIHRSAGDGLRRCYAERLRERPRLRGRWRARFVIDASGRVLSLTTVESDLSDHRFEQCAMNAIQLVSFPRAPGVTVVTWTFELERRARRSRSPPRIRHGARGPYVITPAP
jgi:hypothetical protein